MKKKIYLLISAKFRFIWKWFSDLSRVHRISVPVRQFQEKMPGFRWEIEDCNQRRSYRRFFGFSGTGTRWGKKHFFFSKLWNFWSICDVGYWWGFYSVPAWILGGVSAKLEQAFGDRMKYSLQLTAFRLNHSHLLGVHVADKLLGMLERKKQMNSRKWYNFFLLLVLPTVFFRFISPQKSWVALYSDSNSIVATYVYCKVVFEECRKGIFH